MRYARIIVLGLLFSFLLAGAACAEEADPSDLAEVVSAQEETVSVDAEADDKNIIVNVTLPAVSADDSAAAGTEDVVEPAADEVADSPSYKLYSLDVAAESAEDPQTVKDTVVALFGAYCPRTQTVTEYLSDGSSVTYTEIVPGLAGLDWEWISSVALFALLLYAVLRMIGGGLRR